MVKVLGELQSNFMAGGRTLASRACCGQTNSIWRLNAPVFRSHAGHIDQLDSEGCRPWFSFNASDFLETLFDTIEDGVADGKAHWHNQSAEHLLSLPLDKAEGQGLAKFLPWLDWDVYENPPTACQ